MILDRELAKLDALGSIWLPIALLPIADLSGDTEPGGTGSKNAIAQAFEMSLKAFDRVFKLSQLRAKLLGFDRNKKPERECRHLTLEEAERRMQEAQAELDRTPPAS